MDSPTNEGMQAWDDGPAGERTDIREAFREMLSSSPDDMVLNQCQKVFVCNGYKLPEALSPTLQIVIREGRQRRLVPPELDASI